MSLSGVGGFLKKADVQSEVQVEYVSFFLHKKLLPSVNTQPGCSFSHEFIIKSAHFKKLVTVSMTLDNY